MTSAHRIHKLLYRGPKLLADPGNAGIITATADLQICEMVSVGADETRTLTNPTKAGIRLVLRMLTDGGDIVVTAANGYNVAVNTAATFADKDDILSLVSVTTVANTTYRWEILEGNVATGISTSTPTATATASFTPTGSTTSSPTTSASLSGTATPTSTRTSTATATGTTTRSASGGTWTVSATKSVSVSTSASASGTATPTSTRTATSTSTVTDSSTSTPTSSSTATSTSTF